MTNFEDFETPAQRLRRALRRFEQQEEADPACADRGLLETASQALVEFLDSGEPPDFAIARDGLTVLFRKQDAQTAAMLMLRALDGPLSDSERAWAYHHLGNMLACSGSAAGAVVAHDAFETWIQGKSPFLARRPPLHDPLPADSPDAWGPSEIRLHFLTVSVQFFSAYRQVWRAKEYFAKFDAAYADVIPSPGNLNDRFGSLAMASEAADQAGDFERAQTYIERMKALADEAADPSHKAGLRIRVLYQIILRSRQRGDEKGLEGATDQALNLIRDAESRGWTDADWMGVVRHNIAHELLMRSRHALALPLLEASASSKRGNRGYTSFMHAVAVWQVTGDRSRTLDLLGHARDTGDRDFIGDFRFHREFDSVADDPEFLRAVSRGSSS